MPKKNLSTPRHYALSYRVYGYGAETIIAFHGYGQDPAVFGSIGQELQGHLRLISISLPGHGKSKVPAAFSKHPFSQEEIILAINNIMEKEGIRKFHVLAYSLGGRLALMYFCKQPQNILSMTLIAPDGFRKVPIRKFVTTNPLGIALFRFTVKFPGLFFFLLAAGRKIGFIPLSTYKFVLLHTRTRELRNKLFHVWRSLRGILIHKEILQLNYTAGELPFQFIFGDSDRIIPASSVDEFVKDKANTQVHILSEGHNLLRVRNAKEIAGHIREITKKKEVESAFFQTTKS